MGVVCVLKAFLEKLEPMQTAQTVPTSMGWK